MALVLDGDNGIVGVLATNADGDVIIDTNTFFVDADNNRVGIGTTTPNTSLHILAGSSVGSLTNAFEITDSGYTNIQMLSGGADGEIKIGAAGQLRGSYKAQYAGTSGSYNFNIGTNATNAITIDTSQLVGIGTSSGNEKLTVAGAISATASSANFAAGPERVFMDIAAGENAVRFGHLQGTTSAARDIKFISGNATRMTMYSAGKLGINTQPDSGTLEVIALTDNPALLVTNSDLTHSSSAYYSNRNSRNLTSNGTNWAQDGRDPAIVVGSHNDGTDKGEGLGIWLHNESLNDNTFSPGIYFGNKSNSGIYNTAYGYIMGRKTGQGVDPNWSIGEVWIDTAGTKHNGNDAYMDDSPAIRVRTTGTVDMRWQAFSYGTIGGNNQGTQNTGWTMSPQLTQGLNYNNNATHGWGFTVNEEGYYECMATGLYDPIDYVYIGWAINGSQQHHWHSNHTVENNHDFVSHMTRWCNVGDHITLEHSNRDITYNWGGSHSQYSIWKVG